MGHGRAEPNGLHFNDFLIRIIGILQDWGVGQILAAPLLDSLSRPGAAENTVSRGEVDRGEDEFGPLASLTHHGGDEGGCPVHKKLLTQPETGVVKAPEGAVSGDPVSMDKVHGVHGIIGYLEADLRAGLKWTREIFGKSAARSRY